jgi:iron complex transport system substrate-binding protein
MKLFFNLFCVAAFFVSGALAQDATTVRLIETTPTHRVIEHALGQTEVPLDPERIVSLSFFLTDHLLALGVKPAASETYEEDFAYLEPLAEGIIPIPFRGDAYNLEAVLAAQPDLILVGAYDGELYGADYAQLSQIAPTVVVNETDSYIADRWVFDLGVVLGLEEEATTRWAEYQEKLAAARERLEETVGDEKVGLFRVTARDFRVYGNVGYTAVLYDEGVGLTPPELARELAWGAYNESVSLEVLPRLADAEHLFISVDGDEDAARVFEGIEANPLWQRLPAVQAGRVYPVERRVWMNNGLLANERKLADIVRALSRDD